MYSQFQASERRRNKAIADYCAGHGDDDFTDALAAEDAVHYEEVYLPDGRGDFAPAIWIGYRVIPANSGTIDTIFAQKNACFCGKAPPARRFAEILDIRLSYAAQRYNCHSIRFCGRYGWQRYARRLGYTSAKKRSPRGYPYFCKMGL